jgi:TRAP-type C4-dicarboxylate transport system permease small subunit
MQITRKETHRTEETRGSHMSIDNFEKSVTTIGAAVLVQFVIKWLVIAFLGWFAISSVNQWIISATS